LVITQKPRGKGKAFYLFLARHIDCHIMYSLSLSFDVEGGARVFQLTAKFIVHKATYSILHLNLQKSRNFEDKIITAPTDIHR